MIFGLELADFVPFFGVRGVEDPIAFSTGVLVSTAIDALAIHWRLRRARNERLNAQTIAESVVAGAASFLVKIPVLAMWLGLSGFGVIFATWCHLIFALGTNAVFASIRILANKREATRGALALACLGGLIWPAAAYARFLEPFRLKVERATVTLDDRAAAPLRIGVLADLQTDQITAYENHVVDTLLAETPDLILIPGDLFHGIERDFAAELPEFRALLARLGAPLGVYFVTGDVDPPSFVSRLFEGTSIVVLDNRVIELEAPGGPLVLGGLAPDARLQSAREAAAEFARKAESATYRIAFSHRPDVVSLLDPGRADIFICGHTHGGQIVLPFFGPPLTLTSLPRHIADGGLDDFEGRRMYVSRGAGLERTQAPRVRFLCPPEVTLITLRSSEPP
jgi:uncharacterized protein